MTLLEKNTKKFDDMEKRSGAERLHPLVLRYKIPKGLLHNLELATALYVSRSIPEQSTAIREDELLSLMKKNRHLLKNCTPGGFMVPKRHIVLEFNMMVKAYVDIIETLNIRDLIASWSPPQIRYKDGLEDVVPSALERPYATEKIHSDTWEGEFPEGASTMIPLFGDVVRNRVDFMSYPDLPDEEWIKPSESYSDFDDLVKKSKRLDIPFSKGYLIVRDITMLHVTVRDPGATSRVSLDTYFTTRMPNADEKGRVGDYTYDIMRSIGTSKVFAAPHNLDQRVETSFKQNPAYLKLVDIPQA